MTGPQILAWIVKPLCTPEKLTETKAKRTEKDDFSIFSTALRITILNIPVSSAIGSELVATLLPYLRNVIFKFKSVDDMDILTSLIERFGPFLTEKQIEATEQDLLQLLLVQGIIQKRAIITLGKLTAYLKQRPYVLLLEHIVKYINESKSQLPNQNTRNAVILANTIAKSDPNKLKPYLSELVPLIISMLYLDLIDDEEANEDSIVAEVREASLTTIETIITEFDSPSVSPYVDKFTDIALKFLRYDPNFVTDNEEEEINSIFKAQNGSNDVDMEDEEDEDDEENFSDDGEFFDDDETGFSDDDDQTWKLRRLAGKIVSGLVKANPMSLSYIYSTTLKPLIVACIKERQDSVKVALLEALADLIDSASSDRYFYATRQNYRNKRKASAVSNEEMQTDDPQTLLQQVLPVFTKNFIEILNSKDANNAVKRNVLVCFKNLANVVRFPSDILLVIVNTISSLASTSQSTYLSDILQIVSSLLIKDSTLDLAPLFPQLIEIIINGISASYYKLSGEALDTVFYIFPHYAKNSDRLKADTSALQETLVAKVEGSSFDGDIRKKAIKALSLLVYYIPITEEQVFRNITAISDQLDNELLLRLDALTGIKTFVGILDTPDKHTSPVNIDLIPSSWAVKILNEISGLLRQNSEAIRSETMLVCRSLSSLVSRRLVPGSSTKNSQDDIDQYTKFLYDLVENFKANASRTGGVSGDSINSVLKEDPTINSIISNEILLFAEGFDGIKLLDNSKLLKLITSSVKDFVSVKDDLASVSIEESLLQLFDKITKNLSSDQVEEFYDSLLNSTSTGTLIPAITGLTIVNCNLDSQISYFVDAIHKPVDISASSSTAQNERLSTIRALRVLSYVGRHKPLDISLKKFYELFDDESLRMEASKAVGQIAIGNLEAYVPEILELLATSDKENQYLYLVALKSVVTYIQEEAEKSYKATTPTSPLSTTSSISSAITPTRRRSVVEGSFEYTKYVQAIWNCLFSLNFEDTSQEGEKATVAECIGRLSIIDPETFLPELKSLLASPEVSVRRSVVSAIKYTFGQKLEHEKYDIFLRPIIVDFLVLMEDKNLSIRQVSLSTLISAIKNKSHLLIPHLDRLLPILYKETVKNMDLVRVIRMGPFRHNVDDGLELRKAAYEAMFTLVTALPLEIQLNLIRDKQFYSRIFAGLEDDHDIRVMNCVTLGRMVATDVRFLTLRNDDLESTDNNTLTNLDKIIKQFNEIVNTQLKSSASKQEFESHSELVRNVFNACQVIDDAISLATGKARLSANTQNSTGLFPASLPSSTNLNNVVINSGKILSNSSTNAPVNLNASKLVPGSNVTSNVNNSGLTDADIEKWNVFYSNLLERQKSLES